MDSFKYILKAHQPNIQGRGRSSTHSSTTTYFVKRKVMDTGSSSQGIGVSERVLEGRETPLASSSHVNNTNDVQEAVERLRNRAEKFDDMSYARVSLILFSLGLCTFLYAFEQTVVATAVSDIGAGVKATGSLTWISTSYLLTTTVIQPLTGRLSDVFGTKRMLVCEVWVFIIGNIIAGTAHSLAQLVAGRLVAGVGAAGLLSLCTIIVSQLTNERQRSTYLNLINCVFIVADSLGPILGGLLAKSGDWRWIFLLNAPIGPVITAIFIYSVHIPVPSRQMSMRATIRSMDLFGMTMLVCWLTLLIVALNLGGDAYSWNSSVIIGLLAGTGVTFIAFLIAESKALYPVVPLGLFVSWKYRNVPIITIARTLLFFHLYATTFYIPIFLQVAGHSSTLAAALVIPFLVTAAVASITTNYYASRHGIVRPPFWIGLAILPIGMGLVTTLDEGSSIGRVVAYTIICGLGFGSGTTVTLVIPQAGLPTDLLPTVTAFISALPNLGGVLGVGIIGTVINNKFRSSMSTFATSGYALSHINDAVAASKDPLIGSKVVTAYVGAFQLGYRILTGIAVLQLIICLGLGRVVLDGAAGNAEEKENVEMVSIAEKGTDDKLDDACGVQKTQIEKVSAA